MARICPLFSGSTGNSTYIAASTGSLLIDAGVSFRYLYSAVSCAGGDIGNISAVLITHEHYDHIKGLKPLLNKTHARLIASEQTLEALARKDKIPAGNAVEVIDSKTVVAGGIAISRFSTIHDCQGSSGYVLELPDHRRVAVCTDLGVVTEEVHAGLHGCDAVLLESNHDVEMQKKGPYPPDLKMRILSKNGHLSNPACAAELSRLLNSGTKRFILGHISQQNNTPLLAETTTVSALMDMGARKDKDYLLWVAAPSENGVAVL